MGKALLLRVGIDSGCGGTLGPIFPDGTFEYIPIPEIPEYVSPRSTYFRQLPARHGGALEQYVPPRYRKAAAHYDPEFETFTYGDPGKQKRSQLLRLDKGDLLVFYAGLRPVGEQGTGRLYIIGFFTVAAVEAITATNPWPPRDVPHLLKNAHLRRNHPDPDLVVARGHTRRSRLLDRAIAISDDAHQATREMERKMGIKGSLRRAIGRWVSPERTKGSLNWIVREGGARQPRRGPMRTLIYKRTHSGDPDPQTGVFGNNDCMKRVRGWSFDAVIGVGGVGRKAERNGIASKLTWVGIGPHKTGNRKKPLVAFNHFLYYGEDAPLLEERAPRLARHIYDGKVRLMMESSLPEAERREVQKILKTARAAPPSSQRRRTAPRRKRSKDSSRCR
jgi:hypothetical protein